MTDSNTLNVFQDCLSCAEPWEVLPGLLRHTEQPAVFFSAPGNATRGVDSWWPPNSTAGGGYSVPECSSTGCAPATGGRQLPPQCGLAASDLGGGCWFRFGPPAVAANGTCPTARTGPGNATCAMEYVPQNSTQTLGFGCRSYACNAGRHQPANLGARNGLLAYVQALEGELSDLWWWPLMTPTDQTLVATGLFPTLVAFRSNSDWYPLFSAFNRVLSSDVIWTFDGYIKPDFTCANGYTIYLDSDNEFTEILIESPAGAPMLRADTGPQYDIDPNNRNVHAYAGLKLLSGGAYHVRISYPMPASLGVDPATNETRMPLRPNGDGTYTQARAFARVPRCKIVLR